MYQTTSNKNFRILTRIQQQKTNLLRCTPFSLDAIILLLFLSIDNTIKKLF